MTAVAELFDQIFFEAIKRDHPVLLCIESLSRCRLYAREMLSKKQTAVSTFRLPTELVAAATDFFDSMDSLKLRQSPNSATVLCGICGSDLCLTYAHGFAAVLSAVASIQKNSNMTKFGG
jgi:hypothetical protein